MISFPIWVPTVVSLVVGAFVVFIGLKIQAELLKNRSEILDAIRMELKLYVSEQRFHDYIAAHGRETETQHREITDFMIRHRDWKHNMEPWARGVDMKVDDLLKDVDQLKCK